MKRTISEGRAVPSTAGEAGPDEPEAARRPLRELMDDRLPDALLERARAGGAGAGLESELTAHLGYEKGGRGTPATGTSLKLCRPGRCLRPAITYVSRYA